MRSGPIAAILAGQSDDGWWVTPGPGYGPKYTGTVWSLIFLDQLGADAADERVQRACRYVLRWVPTSSGGFGCSGSNKERNPPPSVVIHCLNGNLIRALIGFGHLDDDAVHAAISWAARAIIGGSQAPHYYASSTYGPAIRLCGQRQAALRLASRENRSAPWPASRSRGDRHRWLRPSRWVRSSSCPGTRRWLTTRWATATRSRAAPGSSSGSRRAMWPTSSRCSRRWQSSEWIDDPRLGHALDWVAEQQGPDGRWVNRYAYNHKTWSDIERQGAPSKWVTLRACTVLRAAG